MMHLNKQKTIFRGLACLIFTAILVDLAFSDPLTAFASHEPNMKRQDTLSSLGTIRTPSAPGTVLSTLIPVHVYLPLVMKTGGGPVVTPTPTPTPTSPPPGSEGALFLNRTKKTDSASAAVDAAGGFHLAYAAFVPFAEGSPAFYAYCTANCASTSNWGKVSLSDRVEEVQLALTAAGHPRLLLRGKNSNYDDLYQYAVCDINCTDLANWTIADVTTSPFSPSSVMNNSYSGHHYFALDHLDRPRFLYQTSYTEAFYIYCDTACTSAPKWLKYAINAGIFSDADTIPMLTFTGSDQPRITAFMKGTDSKDYLTTITCDNGCDILTNWTYTALMERGTGHVSFVLRLTSSGQPRLVFEQGSLSPGPGNYLWYLWCNTGCTNSANWAGSSVGAQGQAQDADLALNALNRPRIAFRRMTPEDGLGYFSCDTNCESNSASWSGGLVEPSSDLDVEWDILPPAGCTSSYWYSGYRPSLALDSAGNPRIGYVAQHLHGGSSCTAAEDYRAVRFAFFNQP